MVPERLSGPAPRSAAGPRTRGDRARFSGGCSPAGVNAGGSDVALGGPPGPQPERAARPGRGGRGGGGASLHQPAGSEWLGRRRPLPPAPPPPCSPAWSGPGSQSVPQGAGVRSTGPGPQPLSDNAATPTVPALRPPGSRLPSLPLAPTPFSPLLPSLLPTPPNPPLDPALPPPAPSSRAAPPSRLCAPGACRLLL